MIYKKKIKILALEITKHRTEISSLTGENT